MYCLSYNALNLLLYYSTNIMIKIYFSDETYKLRNLNHRNLPELGRSISGHDVSQYCESFQTYWKHYFFYSTFRPKITQRGEMKNGPKMNCRWPLRHIGMGAMVWVSAVGCMGLLNYRTETCYERKLVQEWYEVYRGDKLRSLEV
jgi:hypothetical protein